MQADGMDDLFTYYLREPIEELTCSFEHLIFHIENNIFSSKYFRIHAGQENENRLGGVAFAILLP